ncbi:MAG: hypothetical protein ACREXS_14180 [Gammaproteobacteria bacterium]
MPEIRALFHEHVFEKAIDDMRFAGNRNQPPGNERFSAKIERMTGQQREAKPPGRPRRGVNRTERQAEVCRVSLIPSIAS